MEQPKKKERRQFARVKKTLYVMYHPYGTTAPWNSATVQDIGEAGMSISTVNEFAIGEVLEIKITTFLKPQPIILLGKVVCCEGRGSEKRNWIVHVSFTDIKEEDKPVLQEFIQAFLKFYRKGVME